MGSSASRIIESCTSCIERTHSIVYECIPSFIIEDLSSSFITNYADHLQHNEKKLEKAMFYYYLASSKGSVIATCYLCIAYFNNRRYDLLEKNVVLAEKQYISQKDQFDKINETKILNVLGMSYLEVEKYDLAKIYLTRAYVMNANIKIVSNLVKLCCKTNAHDDLIKYYDLFIYLFPKDKNDDAYNKLEYNDKINYDHTLYTTANSLHDLGLRTIDNNLANKYFMMANKIRPYDVSTLYNLIIRNYVLKNHDHMMKYYETLMNIETDLFKDSFVHAICIVAKYYLLCGKIDEMKSNLWIGIKKYSDKMECLNRLLDYYRGSDDISQVELEELLPYCNKNLFFKIYTDFIVKKCIDYKLARFGLSFVSANQEQCTICLENGDLFVNTFCAHILCIECFKKIYPKKCPFCRGEMCNI
jgi:tetratricopeptide (TPR) repeat protein